MDNYFKELRTNLSKLSKEEQDEMINFYQEYAEEANLNTYDELVNHFGTPKNLSSKIYSNSATKIINNEKSKPNTMKALKFGLLALLSLPFSFPILIVVLSICFALFVAFISIIFSFIFALAIMLNVGFGLFVHSFSYLNPFEFSYWAQSLGGGLALFGLCGIFIILLFLFGRVVIKGVTKVILKLVDKEHNND